MTRYVLSTLLLMLLSSPSLSHAQSTQPASSTTKPSTKIPTLEGDRIHGVNQNALLEVMSRRLNQNHDPHKMIQHAEVLTATQHLAPATSDWMRIIQPNFIAPSLYDAYKVHLSKRETVLRIWQFLRMNDELDVDRAALLQILMKSHRDSQNDASTEAMFRALVLLHAPKMKVNDDNFPFPIPTGTKHLKDQQNPSLTPHELNQHRAYMKQIALRHINRVTPEHRIHWVPEELQSYRYLPPELMKDGWPLHQVSLTPLQRLTRIITSVHYPAPIGARALPPLPQHQPDQISRDYAYLIKPLPDAKITADQRRELLSSALQSQDAYFKFMLLSTLVHTPDFERDLQYWIMQSQTLHYETRMLHRRFLRQFSDHLMTDMIMQPLFMWSYREGYRTSYFKYLAMMGPYAEAQVSRLGLLLTLSQGDYRRDIIRCLSFLPVEQDWIFRHLAHLYEEADEIDSALIIYVLGIKYEEATVAHDILNKRYRELRQGPFTPQKQLLRQKYYRAQIFTEATHLQHFKIEHNAIKVMSAPLSAYTAPSKR